MTRLTIIKSCILSVLLSTLTTTTVTAADTPSGCGKQQSNDGNRTYGFTSSGLDRAYFYHLPDNYDVNTQYPVIIAFPGNTEPAIAMEADTGLSKQNVTGDKIIIYAQGYNSSWAGASYSIVSLQQDFDYVTDSLNSIRSQFCVNNQKIYATGFSLGAQLVNLIACDSTLSSQFAAFAPHSGSYYQEANSSSTCTPSRSPEPILFIHGGEDSEVPYDGGVGQGGILPGVQTVVDRWVTRNKCTQISEEQFSNNDVQHWSWQCQGYQNLTQLWKVDDMDHQWASLTPDLTSLAVSGKVSKIEASVLINTFFDLWELDKEVAVTTGVLGTMTTSASGVLLSTTQGTTTAPAVLATVSGGSDSSSNSGNATATTATGSTSTPTTVPTAESTSGSNAAVGNVVGMQGSIMGAVMAVLAALL